MTAMSDTDRWIAREAELRIAAEVAEEAYRLAPTEHLIDIAYREWRDFVDAITEHRANMPIILQQSRERLYDL